MKLTPDTPKVAICIVNGVVQEIRSNIRKLNMEIFDTDNQTSADRWVEEIKNELEFSIFDS